jgi:hypothetical protein
MSQFPKFLGTVKVYTAVNEKPGAAVRCMLANSRYPFQISFRIPAVVTEVFYCVLQNNMSNVRRENYD